MTSVLAAGLVGSGCKLHSERFFDTITISPVNKLEDIKTRAREEKINLRYNEDGSIGVSLDETTTLEDVNDLFKVFGSDATVKDVVEKANVERHFLENSEFRRTSPYLQHPIFNLHHSETRIVRYMKRLENKDVSLVHSMIPLVSKNSLSTSVRKF